MNGEYSLLRTEVAKMIAESDDRIKAIQHENEILRDLLYDIRALNSEIERRQKALGLV